MDGRTERPGKLAGLHRSGIQGGGVQARCGILVALRPFLWLLCGGP